MEHCAEHFRRALAGESTSYETEYRGRIVWSQFVPLRDEQGQVLTAMSLAVDITDQVLMAREKARLEEQNVYLREEIQTVHNYEEIVGSSPALLRALDAVGRVRMAVIPAGGVQACVQSTRDDVDSATAAGSVATDVVATGAGAASREAVGAVGIGSGGIWA